MPAGVLAVTPQIANATSPTIILTTFDTTRNIESLAIQRCCPPAHVYRRDLTEEAELLKALGDPYRLTIMATLARIDDEACVCDFTDALPLNQPTVSHHLKILRDSGLVRCERRGTWVYYKLAPDARRRIDAALNITLPEKVIA